MGAALMCYAPLATVLTIAVGAEPAVVVGLLVVGLSMLPVIDMRLPLVTHRGPTHTVYFLVAVAGALTIGGILLGIAGGSIVGGILVGLLLGLIGAVAVGSHLLADMLTPAGVDLYATGSRRSYNVARAANPIANYALLGLGVLFSGAGIVLGQLLATGIESL